MKSKVVKTLAFILGIAIALCFTGIILVLSVSSALNQNAEASVGFSTAEKPFAGGDGTKENPYLIANAYHLNNVRHFFYHRNLNGQFDETKPNYFLQIDDVNLALSDFNGEADGNFEPIGTAEKPFPGIYEGKSFKITNVNIHSSNDSVGLFGATSSSAKIYRIALVNSTVVSSASLNTGAIVGLNAGLLEQSFSSSEVFSTASFVGGLVGRNEGTIKNSYNSGNVSGTKTGGIVGNNAGAISGCYNIGTLGTEKGGVIHTQTSGEISNLAYLSTTASSAIYSGTADETYIKSVTSNQLAAGEKISVAGTDVLITELLNKSNSLEMPSYFYNSTSSYIYPQIWSKAQDESFVLKGDGTVLNPFLVTSPQVFSLIGKEIELSELYKLAFGMDANYVQSVDINFRGVDTNFELTGNFSPIGENLPAGANSFSGTYSGSSSSSRCAIIEGIEYESTSLNMALFLNIGNGAKVSGIEIRNFVFNIQAPSIFVYAGIASENNGTIENCVNSNNLTHSLNENQINTTNIAGIVSTNKGTIVSCANLGDFDVTLPNTVSGGTSFVAGIAANSSGVIDKCYNSGRIRGGQSGGIAVIINEGGVLSNSYNSGEISAALVITGEQTWEGGLVCNAMSGSTIKNCYNAGKSYFGIGTLYSNVSNTYYLSGMSTKDQYNGNTSLAINANQLAGQTAIGGAANIINLFGSDVWEFDWAYLGRDGVAYQFPQIKNNKEEYHHTTAMKVNNEGFHEVDSFEKFNAICSTYNGISYPGDGWFNLTTDVNYSNTTYAVKSEFSGKLYGNGHFASNITISSKNSENVGFFGVIQGTAEITEFGIINCTVKSTNNSNNSSVGAFAGLISHGAKIVNCYVQTGYVEGLNNIGGFAGAIASTGTDGAGNGKVEGCRVINTQVKYGKTYQDTTDPGAPTGGFVGWTNGANISSSYYMHSDTNGGKNGSSVWGLFYLGGFVGKTEGTTNIGNCFAYGSVWCNRTIVAAARFRETIGGFVGVNTSSSTSITNCYARMTMTKNSGVRDSKSIKGFGYNTGNGTFSNNYCLSGQNYNASGGAGATEKSESELKIQSTFSGWDFSNVWTMSSTAEMPFGMPIPKKSLAQTQETWNLRVKTDGNSIIQVYNGATLIKQLTSSSSGVCYVSRIPLGTYQVYVIRNGQKVLDSSTVSSYASFNIEMFEVTISSANQVYDLQTEKWFTSGSGTENDPYIISILDEFEKLNKFDGFGEATHFALYKNLDLKNQEINGINNFKGVFDGRNHIISNFQLNSSNSNLGLFNNAINATIKNLGVRNFNLTSLASESYYSGALVGKAESSLIVSCFADHGFLNVNVNAGSLIGLLSGGTVKYSYSTNNVTSIVSNGTSVSNLGGFVGKATGGSVIEECYSDGSVAGSRLIGGFVAEADNTTIKNTYTRVFVTTDYNGRDNPEVGGYAGIISAAAKIENSFMFGTISTDLTTTAGNFAGVNSSESLVNVYYWNNNSLEGIGKNNASAAAKPLSTTEFNQASSFEEYDFIEIWGMPSESSAVTGAPVLRRVVNAFEINEKILGKGTEQNPYIIFDEKTLLEVMDLVNANPGKVLYFKIQKNIELSSSNWVGLGTETNPFTGVFDGNNKNISGLKFSRESTSAVGLFGYVQDATIKNLNIINPLIETSSAIDAGAIVGKGTNLKFENVSVSSGSISSAGNSGALAGNIEKGNVKNSSASGVNVSGENGGLVGKATNVEFFNCQTLSISVSATQNAGSIVGLLENGIIHNLSVGVNTLNAPIVGGIAGTIVNSKIKSVSVSHSNASGASYLGGAVGIANSSSIIGVNVLLGGSLSATTSVGALVGKANGSTLNNNTVNTRWGASTSTLSALNVGGLVGEAENMVQLKENRMCQLVLSPSSSSGYVGQLYGKLTGNANASKTLFASIEISNSAGATSNALSGINKTETDTNEAGAIERVTWTYVE